MAHVSVIHWGTRPGLTLGHTSRPYIGGTRVSLTLGAHVSALHRGCKSRSYTGARYTCIQSIKYSTYTLMKHAHIHVGGYPLCPRLGVKHYDDEEDVAVKRKTLR